LLAKRLENPGMTHKKEQYGRVSSFLWVGTAMSEPNLHPQSRPPQRRRATTRLIIGFATLILLGATGWILSINNVISSLWASIFSAVFAILGVLLSLVQAHLQSSSQQALAGENLLENEPVQSHQQTHTRDRELGINRQRGAIVIRTGSQLRGSTIGLCKGFHADPVEAIQATNVVKRPINGAMVFAGVFPGLKPGNYIVFCEQSKKAVKISVHANSVSEIDWR
jgi:hypothetical protein